MRLKLTSGYFKGYPAAIKPSIYSGLLNYMSTSGYNNPFTGEAQINTLMPMVDRPVTACHEMAHQFGFAREDEANFIGFLAASTANDPLLRYSGYFLATQEFLQYLHRRDSVIYYGYKKKLSTLVVADFKADSAYWQRYEGKTERITGIFYNAFLKANNQPAGLHTYNRMIILTIAYYKKQLRIAKPKATGSLNKNSIVDNFLNYRGKEVNKNKLLALINLLNIHQKRYILWQQLKKTAAAAVSPHTL